MQTTSTSIKNKSMTQSLNKENNPNSNNSTMNYNTALNSFSELTTSIVIISNISRNLTKRHLQEIFSFYGPLKGVYVPKDEESKLNKNYAYLEFMNKEDAEKAILYMSEGQIDGLKVKLEILNPPEKESYTKDKEVRDRDNREREKIDRDTQRDDRKDYNSGSRNYSSLKRRRSRSRSRRRSPSNKYRGINYHNRHNRSRSNNRRHHRKGSYSSSSSQRSSSESSHKSSSSS
jgi:RNA recognition motif-containing protein